MANNTGWVALITGADRGAIKYLLVEQLDACNHRLEWVLRCVRE